MKVKVFKVRLLTKQLKQSNFALFRANGQASFDAKCFIQEVS